MFLLEQLLLYSMSSSLLLEDTVYDIYRELGAYNVLTYARFENDTENPDFITGNQFGKSWFD